MSQKSDGLLQNKIDQLRIEIARIADQEDLAFRCGFELNINDSNSFLGFSLFNTHIMFEYPDLELIDKDSKSKLSVAFEAMVYYYMKTADGCPLVGKWISFGELPDGMFYNAAFQGYTGDKLSALIGNNVENFIRTALQLNGVFLPFGDASFKFQALPKVPLAIVFWNGDDEFPPSCKILFDASVTHYLPADGCAILGSILTNMIQKKLVADMEE